MGTDWHWLAVAALSSQLGEKDYFVKTIKIFSLFACKKNRFTKMYFLNGNENVILEVPRNFAVVVAVVVGHIFGDRISVENGELSAPKWQFSCKVFFLGSAYPQKAAMTHSNWWWSSGHRTRLLLWRSKFDSLWGLQILWSSLLSLHFMWIVLKFSLQNVFNCIFVKTSRNKFLCWKN